MSLSAKRLSGVLTAILTPFDLNGNLALEHFPALLDFQRSAGIDGVIVCGTNGEGTSLSVSERKMALEAVLAHRGELAVVAGTGAVSITDAVELTRHAADVGADAVLVLPPFFYKNPSAQGLADYFRAVLDAAPLPNLLYNIPQHSAVPITDEVLALLHSHPNLAGLKDSSGEWDSALHYIETYPALQIFAGSDKLASRSFAHGANSISGGANMFPEVVTAIRDAARQGLEQANAAQERADAIFAITTRYPFISTSKAVIAHRGLPRLGVRPPLVPLSEAQEQSLLAELTRAGFSS